MINFRKLSQIVSWQRAVFYFLVLLAIAGMVFFGWREFERQRNLKAVFTASSSEASDLANLIGQYDALSRLFLDAKNKYPEIDLSPEEAALPDLRALLDERDLIRSKAKYDEIMNSFNAKVAIEEQKQELNGIVSYAGKGIAGVDIQILQNGVALKTKKNADDGSYKTWLLPGKYSIKIVLAGYNEYNAEIDITEEAVATSNIALVKPVAVVSKPKTSTAPSSASDSSGLYSKQTIATDRGSFTIHLLTVNLSEYRMIVDTAADGDCADNCPVLSLEQYVSRNAGIAGLHGTYFCPTAYADCAGKTNSFYFKIFNGRIGQRINWSNGLGDYLPFLRISSGGSLSYHSTWAAASGLDMSTGISCRPHLVEGGNIVLTASDMESDKESSYKMSHGFIGHKGQTVYAGIVLSANLYDSAAVSKALGLEDSFNLDGGGTTAMFANGGYKAGPGRAMPNAIVFKRR